MSRWRIDLGYDGADFYGWAVQPGLRTVQGELETWITRLLQLDQPAELVVAGRTDAGVHARHQVAHLDLPDDRSDDVDDLARRLLRVLPDDLIVHRIAAAPTGFDARFSASWRHYCYRLWDDTSSADPIRRGNVLSVRGSLDLTAMAAGAQTLLGLRNFAPFCKWREGATMIRDLKATRVRRRADGCGTIEVELRADAFCRSMVRSVVGALVEVGSGRRDATWLAAVAATSVRASEVTVLPAKGLTLEKVGYPPRRQLAARAAQARSIRTLPTQEQQ